MEPNTSMKNNISKIKRALSNNIYKPQEKTHFQQDGPLAYHATKLPCYYQTHGENISH